MGGKWVQKMPTLWNFAERLQVSEVCPWVSRGEGRVEIQKTFREKSMDIFREQHIDAKFTSFIEPTWNYASKNWPLKAWTAVCRGHISC